jgi:type IV pilus assembly protein PilW
MISRLNKSGFTLVEVLVAMAIATIVSTLMYKVYQGQLKSHTTQQELVEMQQNLRAVLNLMERDIRMAGYGPKGGVADPAITSALIDDISFAMDVTGGTTLDPSDGQTNDPGEQIQYRIDDAGNLVRITSDGLGGWNNDILLESADINSLTFTYKDEGGNPPATLADIRSVEITLDANIGTTVMVDRHDMALTSEVKCRNLGLN